MNASSVAAVVLTFSAGLSGCATSPALTDEQITKLKTQVVEQWVAAQKADMSISSELEPTPTPETQIFEPPAAAPPTPTPEPTPEPTPTPEGSPLADPVASPVG